MILIATPDYVARTGGTYRAVHDQVCMQRQRGIETRVWARSGEEDVGVLRGPKHIPWRKVEIVNFAAVWHPFHLRAWFATRQRGKPWVVSPHGMYEPYILGRRPRLKRVVRWLVQDRILRGALCLHATSQPEANQLRKLFPDTPVDVIPNAIDTEVFFPKSNGELLSGRARRVAIYAGRLHAKKRPAELMEWWIQHAPQYPDWVLEVASPPAEKDFYGQRCKKLLSLGRSAGCIRHRGFLDPFELAAAYRAADLFVLPTLSENFCLAIGEALACGTPVVTTRGAPWPILEETKSGWWTGLELEAFFDAFAQALKLSPVELAMMGSRGASYVRAELAREVVADRWCAFWDRVKARLVKS
ncbi:MAG: glycosyltransferase [Verrucomicrobiia bacterium]